MMGKRYHALVRFHHQVHDVKMHVGQDLGGWTVGFNSPTTGTFKKSHLKAVTRYETQEEAEAVLAELAGKYGWPEVKA